MDRFTRYWVTCSCWLWWISLAFLVNIDTMIACWFVLSVTLFGPLLEVEMSKKCTPLWREADFEVKMYKTHHCGSTFGSCDVEKVHAVVARSTFPSQNAQSTPLSEHFWKLRCRKSARRGGAKHISKSKCAKHTMYGPFLEVQMPKKCTPLWREAHFQVKMYKAHHVRTIFGGSDVVSHGRRKGLWTLSKVTKAWRFCSIFNYNHHYTTLHSNTVHYTTTTTTPSLHSTTLHSTTPTTLHYTTLNYIQLLSITLHYITLHYLPLHYITLHYTTFHYITLHYTTLHYNTLHYITLHYITLHYLPLHYITLHYIHPTTPHYTTLRYLPLHSTTSHYTTLHYITLHHTTLPSTTLHYITLHYTPLHYNYYYTTTLHYTPLHSTTLHYTKLHYTTLHSTTLHYTTLHYLPLHFPTLHYTTLNYATTTTTSTLHYTSLR